MLSHLIRDTPRRTLAIAISLLGLFLFKQGFLLTRTSLSPLKSECTSPPAKWPNHTPSQSECWSPRPYPQLRRCVVLIIDALRSDFAIWQTENETNHFFHNLLPVLSHTKGSVLLRANVDPPTTTFQRLKALVTGTLPTFIEFSNNFGSGAGNDLVHEDSVLSQIWSRHKAGFGNGTTMMGDDTWLLLFNHLLHKSHPYPSLDVFDLDTVDNGCIEHLFEDMQAHNWDLLVSHFLGVDHVGHRYGPSHVTMTHKLSQLDKIIDKVVQELPDDALLVVIGDHGMDPKGDHGGDSRLETNAALWFYANDELLTNTYPKDHPAIRTVNQIDLVPTLSLILGLPIPFENLGSVIPHIFPAEYVSHAQKVNAAQVMAFLNAYMKLSPTELSIPVTELPNPVLHPTQFLDAALALCRSVWAQFHLLNMATGILFMLGGVLLLFPDLVLLRVTPWSALWVFLVINGCFVYSDNGIIYEDAFTHVLLSVLIGLHTLFIQLESHRGWSLAALLFTQVAYQVHVCRPENHLCVNTFTNTPGTAVLGGLVFMGWALVPAPGESVRFRFMLCGIILTSLVLEEDWIPASKAWISRSVSVWMVRIQLASLGAGYAMGKVSVNTAILMLVSQFHRIAGLTGLISSLVVVTSFQFPVLKGRHPPSATFYVMAISFLIRTTLFSTGHLATLNSIQWNVGHLGLFTTHSLFSPLAILMNTLGHVLVLMVWTTPLPKSRQLWWGVVGWELMFLVNSSIGVAILRRHLMVWGVFAPRWMLASLIYVFVVCGFGAHAFVVWIRNLVGPARHKFKGLSTFR